MKTLLSLSALLITLTLTAQSNPATWYLNNTSGSGIQTYDATASGDFSTAMGRETIASGDFSTAMGYYTTASGDYSTAMGLGTIASGYGSTAMGLGTIASGYGSTAMGAGTTASGNWSTAMGYHTEASDRGSLVIGQYNLLGSTVTNSATQFSTENTAFVIGNGADGDNRSDALTVLFDGTTNVAGSVTATAFIGDGSQLTNLSVSSPFSLNDESGTGGIETFGSIASGNSSRALGCCQTTASGDFSTALGGSTLASGSGSTTMGYYTEASGDFSTAMGYQTTASGDYSAAMGVNTTASGDYSVAIGNNLNATEIYSVAIGTLNTSSGYASTTLGDSNWASGRASTAIGAGTIAEDYAMLSIGTWSLPLESPNPSQFSNSNTAFLIGNGINADSRSNAVQILFDGTTTIAGDLNINSDARLKANIISLGSTLAKLLQIDGKTYTMKKDENKKQKIGVLAQDIEKVFPELVSESNGVKSVNYQGLVPVLINALKEQDSKMNEQEARIERLEKLLLDS